MKSTVSLLLSIAVPFLWLEPALADVTAGVTQVQSAPVAITNCTSDGAHRNVAIFNRAKFKLTSFTVRWTAYDASGKKLGDAPVEYDVDRMASGSSGESVQDVPDAAFTSGSSTSIARYSCTIVASVFDNGSKWSTGKSWSGKLLAVTPSQQQQQQQQQQPGCSAAHGVQFCVKSSWSDRDPDSGQYFIHVRLTIQGGDREVTISPDDFVLTVKLANGGISRYKGLTKAAPTYAKLSAGVPTTAPEVDPTFDLGALGDVTVPVNGPVTVTVTWVVPVAPADLKSNTDVSMP